MQRLAFGAHLQLLGPEVDWSLGPANGLVLDPDLSPVHLLQVWPQVLNYHWVHARNGSKGISWSFLIKSNGMGGDRTRNLMVKNQSA